jgi:hypothetical protein
MVGLRPSPPVYLFAYFRILANVLQGELMQAVLFATWGCCLHTCRALVGVLLLLMQWGDDLVG